MTGHEISELASLYALDTLEGSEQRRFQDHLEDCAECRACLDEARRAATALVPDQPASDETWERIRAAIAIRGQERSRVVPFNRFGSDAAWRWVAVAAAVVALVMGTLLVLEARSDQIDRRTITASAEQAAGRPGSFVGDFLVDEIAVAELVLSDDGQGFVIPTERLPDLGPDRTYQLWVVNDTEEVISAGVLGSRPTSATFTWTGPVSGFALTREVAGGVVSSAGDVVSVLSTGS